MKASREHQVPLPPRAMEILRLAREMSNGSELIFPGRNHSRPLSNMVFAMALRRMNVDATPHGFRSTFRDWAAEETDFPAEVCEMALAHTIRNKTEAAYFRTNLFLKRRDGAMEPILHRAGLRCRYAPTAMQVNGGCGLTPPHY
jgi:integrase